MRLADPMKLKEWLWPEVVFYRKQRQAIYSLWYDDETVVPAGNMLGKDFVAGFLMVAFFLTRHPCRIVTTSTKDKHLNVLWGEANRFIQTSRLPLDSKRGGPLVINQRHIRKLWAGEECPLSYIIGTVANDQTIESFQGHHIAQTGDGIPRTMFIGDEASSLRNSMYDMVDTWANRKLIIGNPWPCENFFKHAVKGKPGSKDSGGDIPRDSGTGYHRKVIHIRGEDSPNVQLGLAEVAAGKQPSNRIIVPGVLPYSEYTKRRKLWDKVRQTVGIDGMFYEGGENLLCPPDWLNEAERYALEIATRTRRARTMGVDSAMGGDRTAWAICDELGLIHLRSMRTPDTTVIPDITVQLIREYKLEAQDVLFDAGGGGKPHADRLRRMGYKVRLIGFGEGATPPRRRGMTLLEEKRTQDETKYVFKNRRAEMYGLLRLRLDPAENRPFALPPDLANYVWEEERPSLRQQLAVIPLLWDPEGRMYLPPKNKRKPDSEEETLIEIIGCSPDEGDALVLANFGLEYKVRIPRLGTLTRR